MAEISIVNRADIAPDKVPDEGKKKIRAEGKIEDKGKNEAKAEKKVGGKKQVIEEKGKPQTVSVLEQNPSQAPPTAPSVLEQNPSQAPPTVPSKSADVFDNLFTNAFGLQEDKEGNVYMFSTTAPMEGFDQEYKNCINYTHLNLVRTQKNMENHYINYTAGSPFKILTPPVYVTGFSSSYGAALFVQHKAPESEEERVRQVRYAVVAEATKKTLLTKYLFCKTKSTDPINQVKFLGESVPIDSCMGKMIWKDKPNRTVSGVKFTREEFEKLQTINIGKKVIIGVDPKPEATLIHVIGRKPEPMKKVNTKSMTPADKKNFRKQKKEERKEWRKKFANSIESCIETADDSNSDDDSDEDEDEEEQNEEERPDQDAPLFFQGSNTQPMGIRTDKVNSALFYENLKMRSTNGTYPAVLCKLVITPKVMNHQAIKKVDPPGGVATASINSLVDENDENDENAEKVNFADSAANVVGGYKLALGSRCTSILIIREVDQSELESSDNVVVENTLKTNLEMIVSESEISSVARPCRKRTRE